MLKKLLMLFLAIGLSLSAVLAAAVEVNTADETALESVKGIGPVHAKAIIDERTKNGPFKDADDLVNRVKGIGPKSVQNLEAAGLTINGSSAPPAGKTASAKSGKSAAATSAAPAATTANPMTAQTPAAATTAQAASDTAASKSKHKSKKDKTAAAASAPQAGSAAAASDTKGKQPRKSKKDKAASAAAASGA
ncbi:helix-hairpin-helix domain-containing protein [Paraburkholderia sp. CNPSo 3272]|uniref:ComEA family DNA-binding protein n=1 Tax=Paraburkholderia sp. CNPSo 3272 TaxID=2940931 RepID=UPI0020B7AC7E|nr:helix-hairpin-helix domain-containing protein [Paraburkholderia sp. CNPSo 3272]MCP3721655.1 helix-hairpin-helix domain-containing protein [Paraburkholderia sp. CNPSo 3272]